MQYIVSIASLGLMALFVHCEKAVKTGNSLPESLSHKVLESHTVYVANNSSEVLFVELDDSLVKLHSTNLSNDFVLTRVPSASGTKYLDTNGFFFWTKGQEFLWGRNDSIWSRGYQGSSSITLEHSEQTFYGHYATKSYEMRDQGYDWVSLSILPMNKHQARVSVRSRADRKKPTCTFDALVNITNDSVLVYHDNSFSIFFRVSEDRLTIDADTKDNQDRLSYYCSGGGNLAGDYIKIESIPDPDQVDQTAYIKTLTWGDMFVEIRVLKDTITIIPNGLEVDNRPVKHTTDGIVYHSEIGDLNQDSYPEILVYLSSMGSGSYGSVIGYSVNNGKSMSEIYLPPIQNSQDLADGYMGHDEFAIVESTLVRRFPIYLPDDVNASPTGGTRQIQYKLVDGEAMRKFEVDKVIDY